MKLFLKGSRCYSEKCAFERRAFAPGQHGHMMRRRVSEYGLQLREKQKVRRIYGILEKQVRNYFGEAARRKGVTGSNLLQLLETRLDNVVYRLGFAPSRKAARQLVGHRHFSVNDKTVDIPSYQVRPNDIIQVREKSRQMDVIHMALKDADRSADLPWLRLNKAALNGELVELPKREDIPINVTEQLIVELYSK
jgi:small subunit ribosomal protein S4